jgi:hypothetical protein
MAWSARTDRLRAYGIQAKAVGPTLLNLFEPLADLAVVNVDQSCRPFHGPSPILSDAFFQQ